MAGRLIKSRSMWSLSTIEEEEEFSSRASGSDGGALSSTSLIEDIAKGRLRRKSGDRSASRGSLATPEDLSNSGSTPTPESPVTTPYKRLTPPAGLHRSKSSTMDSSSGDSYRDISSDRSPSVVRRNKEAELYSSSDTLDHYRELGRDKLAFVSFLRGLAYSHMQGRMYEVARARLEQIEEIELTKDLDTLLMMADCDVHLRREIAKRSVDNLQLAIDNCPSISLEEVKLWADQLAFNGRDVAAMILYRVCGKSERAKERSPKELAVWIFANSQNIFKLADRMMKSGNCSQYIIERHAIEFVADFTEDLKSVPWEDIEGKVVAIGSSTEDLCVLYSNLENHDMAIIQARSLIDWLRKLPNPPITRCQLTGYMYRRLGLGHHLKRRYSKAVHYLEKSISFFEEAQDFRTDWIRKATMEMAYGCLNESLEMRALEKVL